MKEIHLIAFSKWAPIVLQDFNEIDRYLIPQNQIFEYLSAIQEINHWSLDPNSPHHLSKAICLFGKRYISITLNLRSIFFKKEWVIKA